MANRPANGMFKGRSGLIPSSFLFSTEGGVIDFSRNGTLPARSRQWVSPSQPAVPTAQSRTTDLEGVKLHLP